jgi:hypothetical protein
MNITFDKFQQQKKECANFYHAFGFLTIRNSIPEQLMREIVRGYDTLTMARRGQSFMDTLQKGSFVENATVEEFPEFANFFFSPNVFSIVEAFAGKNWIYIGSDFSVFSSYVQSWHRDWVGHFPTVKIACYTNPPYYVGGELRYIPGSHKVGDRFSNSLQQALAWPNLSTRPNGMNENNYFPEHMNYSAVPHNGAYQLFGPGTGDGTNDYVQKNGFSIPHAAIKPGILDLAVFDMRGIHCGSIGLPVHTRIMPAILFCPNPFDDTFDFREYGITQSREELAKDLLTHIVLHQLLQKFKVGNEGFYHPKGLEPPIDAKHRHKLHYNGNKVTGRFGNSQEVTIEFDVEGFEREMGASKGSTRSKYNLTEQYSRYALEQTAL